MSSPEMERDTTLALILMDKILHRFETMVETTACWYVLGNHQKQGLLRWCEMDFAHPRHFCLKNMRSLKTSGS